MRIRVVVSGVFAAAICIFSLWFPWYVVYPASVAPDWPYFSTPNTLPAWFEMAVIVFCGVTLFAFGWVSARWNWSKNWRDSLLSGAGAGLVAGCLIYDFIGAFHFALLGQEEILKAYFVELSQAEGISLMIGAVSKSAYYLYAYFFVAAFVSTILGGLGGLVSAIEAEDVWGTPPREPQGWLFRLSAYNFSIHGAAWTIVALAAILVLQESVVNAAIKNDLHKIDTMPVFISLSVYLACLTMTLFPLGMTWGWAIRSWKTAGIWRVLYVFWVGGTFSIIVYLFVGFIRNGSIFYNFPVNGMALPYDWIFTFVILVIGLSVGLLFSSTGIDSDWHYRTSDWLGYALTQAVFGGTQIFISIPAYAFVLTMITVVNIPHLVESGVVEQTPSQQIVTLFSILTSVLVGGMLFSMVGGLIFAGFISLIRKVFKIEGATTIQNAAVLQD